MLIEVWVTITNEFVIRHSIISSFHNISLNSLSNYYNTVEQKVKGFLRKVRSKTNDRNDVQKD